MSERRFDMLVPNSMSSIEKVNLRFNDLAASAGLPDAVRRRINLVFDELLNNVISYGFEDDELHEIEVCVCLEGDRLVIKIIDDGKPFNPLARETPDTTLPLEARRVGGLGIHLVRRVMDEAVYEREAGRNVVRLVKRVEPV